MRSVTSWSVPEPAGGPKAVLSIGLRLLVAASGLAAGPMLAPAIATETKESVSPPAELSRPSGKTTAVSRDSISIDFESGDLRNWSVAPGDEPHVDFALDRDGWLEGQHALRCTVTGWDTTTDPSNEIVRLTYPLDPPLRLEADTEVSWSWWIADRVHNDGVGIEIFYRGADGGEVCSLPWATHSLKRRGRWPFDDPARVVCGHRELIGEVVRDRIAMDATFPPFPWTASAIHLFFWFPHDQTAYIDAIRIGPAHPAAEDRVPTGTPNEVSPGHSSLLLADLDGDGRLDRLFGRSGHPPQIDFGRGPHSWAPQEPGALGLAEATTLTLPLATDIDGDGHLDLAGFSGPRLLLFRGLGAGRFVAAPIRQPEELVGNPPAVLQAVSIASGKRTDLIISRTNGVRDDGILAPMPGWPPGSRPRARADLDSLGRVGFRFGSLPDSLGFGTRVGYRSAIVPADIDNDLDLDLFCTNTDLLVQGPAGFESAARAWDLPQGSHQVGAAFGDLDNDGDLDLFVAVDIRNHTAADGVIHDHCLLYRNDGDRFTDISHQLGTVKLSHARFPILADFDLDGDLDIFCTQEQWFPDKPLPNVYLRNDGKGRFTQVADPWLWLMRTGPIGALRCADVDDDGDLDLLTIASDRLATGLAVNDAQGTVIKVRILDRHGLPHAGGAHIALYAGEELAGYRQSGVGTVLSGWGEAVFGCPTDGPYRLRVTYPSCPQAPITLTDIEPGTRLTVYEPLLAHPAARHATALWTDWRRWVTTFSVQPWYLLLLAAALGGMLSGMSAYAARRDMVRLRPGRTRASGAGGALPPPQVNLSPAARRLSLVAALLFLVAAVAMLPAWPESPSAARSGAVAAVGLILAMAGGVALARIESRRRRALDASRLQPQQAQLQLLDALDGFSHAGWIKNLSAIASLCRGLIDGADAGRVWSRLGPRIASYEDVVAPQMERIAELLGHAGLDAGIERAFHAHATAVAAGVERLGAQADVDPTTLLDLQAAAGRLSETVETLFRALGRRFHAAVPPELAAAADQVQRAFPDVPIALAFPDELPPVFAVRGELSNIFENLIRNAARAARQNHDQRPPRVTIAARRRGDLLEIEFQDSGPGFPVGQRERLGRQRVALDENHGRGLPYAVRRLKIFDGKLHVTTLPDGEGASVVVTLRVLAMSPRPSTDVHQHKLREGMGNR